MKRYSHRFILTMLLSPSFVFAQGDKATITGTITDAKSGTPLYGTILLEPIQSPDSVRIIANDGKTGLYKYQLPQDAVYNVEVRVPGYLPQQAVITIQKAEVEYNFSLKTIERDNFLEVSNLRFGTNSAKIISGEESLNEVVRYMQANPKVKILLEGHTEPGGTQSAMMKLSKDRIDSVKKFLVSKGISASRISLKAFGGDQPLVAGSSEDDRSANRRVEFKIISR